MSGACGPPNPGCLQLASACIGLAHHPMVVAGRPYSLDTDINVSHIPGMLHAPLSNDEWPVSIPDIQSDLPYTRARPSAISGHLGVFPAYVWP
jgi:hypothetical protein